MHWGDVSAWAAVAVSVIFGVVAVRSARRSRAAEDAATRQADRATTAAEQSARAQKELSEHMKHLAEQVGYANLQRMRTPPRLFRRDPEE